MTQAVSFYEPPGDSSITGKVLDDLVGGATDVPYKLGIRNIGDETLGSTFHAEIEKVTGNDGGDQLRIALDDGTTLSPPWGLTGTLGVTADGGVWGSTGQVAAVVCAVNATGQTVRSSEVSVSVDDITKRITWAWEEVATCTGYRLYRTSTPGAYTTPSLIATPSGSASTSFVDDGSVPAAGAPPSVNTTGGTDAPNYGTPPAVFGVAAVLIGTLAPGQWAFLWLTRVAPANVDPRGNPRQASILVLE